MSISCRTHRSRSCGRKNEASSFDHGNLLSNRSCASNTRWGIPARSSWSEIAIGSNTPIRASRDPPIRVMHGSADGHVGGQFSASLRAVENATGCTGPLAGPPINERRPVHRLADKAATIRIQPSQHGRSSTSNGLATFTCTTRAFDARQSLAVASSKDG